MKTKYTKNMMGMLCPSIKNNIQQNLKKNLLLVVLIFGFYSTSFADISSLPANVYHRYNLNNFDGLTASFTDHAGSILCLGGVSSNANNLIDTLESNYATISFTGLSCDATLSIVDTNSTDYNPAGVFVGFEISALNLLSANVAATVTVTTYLNGTLQESVDVVDNLIGVNSSLLDGSGNAIVGFRTSKDFDEVSITYSALVGVLNTFQVYNAVIKRYETGPILNCNDTDWLNNGDYPTEINSKRTGDGGVLCALCNVNDAVNAISEDTTDYAQFIFGVGAVGGASLSVIDLKSEYDAGLFVGFKVSNGAILDINLLSALEISTYRNDTLQEQKALTDLISLFNYFVGGEEVKTFGFTTTTSFDEVVITVTNVAAVLNYLKIYGAVISKGTPGLCSSINLQKSPTDSIICEGTSVEVAVDSFAMSCAALLDSDCEMQFRYQQPDSAWSDWLDSIITVVPVGNGTFKYQSRRYCPSTECVTDPVEVSWEVEAKHVSATNTTANPSPVCAGEEVILHTNAIPGTNGNINWYTASDSGGEVVGDSATTTVSPEVTTTYYAMVSGNTCANVESSVLVEVKDTGFISLPETRAYASLQEQCTIEDWTYFAEPSQPNKWVFAIRKNEQSEEPFFDVSLGCDTAVISSVSNSESAHGSFLMKRYWNVHLISGSIANGIDIRFYYDTLDLRAAINARDAAFELMDGISKGPDKQWFKTSAYSGGFHPSLLVEGMGNNWNFSITPLAGKDGVQNGVNYVEFNELTSLSGGTGGTSFGQNSPLLPVELASFTAIAKEFTIDLNWLTTAEVNNEKFEVLRSDDAINFLKIGEVEGNGTSSALNKYEFIDRDVTPNKTYYYKLKQIDFNGYTDNSHIVNAKLLLSNQVYSNIYPNPSNTTAFIDIISEKNDFATYSIVNMVGQEMKSGIFNLEKGKLRFSIDVTDLKKGNYILNIYSQSGVSIMRKLQVF